MRISERLWGWEEESFCIGRGALRLVEALGLGGESARVGRGKC